MGDYSSKDFTTPRWHYGEITVNANTTAFVNNDIFKMSRPTLLDYIYFTEESLTVNGWPLAANIAVGQHTSLMSSTLVNWWVTDRARVNLRVRPTQFFDNNVDGQRAQVRIAAFPGNAVMLGSLIYRFRRPWKFERGNSFLIDWSYQTGAATVNAPALANLNFVLYGTGEKTRHRRIFEIQMPTIAAAGPFLGSFTQPEFVSNVADETYLLDELQVLLTGPGIVDMRLLNMLRYRIVPSQGEPWSDDPIPILCYGVDMFPQGRGAIYAPTGGPLLLETGQSIGLEVQNTLGVANTRYQIVLVGRTAPNVYR